MTREKATPTNNTLRNALLDIGEGKIEFHFDDYGFDMYDDQKPSVVFRYEGIEFWVPFAMYSAYIDKPILVPNDKPETLLDMWLDHASHMMGCASGFYDNPTEEQKLANRKHSEKVFDRWHKRVAKHNQTYSEMLRLDIMETQWKVMPEYSKHSYDWMLEEDEEAEPIVAAKPTVKEPEKEVKEEGGGLMTGLGLVAGGLLVNGLLNRAVGGNTARVIEGNEVVEEAVKEAVEELKENVV